MQKAVRVCPFCYSTNLRFEERLSNPVFIAINIFIMNLNIISERRKLVLKCSKCGYEISRKDLQL